MAIVQFQTEINLNTDLMKRLKSMDRQLKILEKIHKKKNWLRRRKR